MRTKLSTILFFTAMLWLSCKPGNQHYNDFKNIEISEIIDQMTELMIHDNTNPPLASRFFSYACLAGYEIVAQNDSSVGALRRKLNEYPAIGKPDSIYGYSYQLAALVAMLETAIKMQPSGKSLDSYERNLLDSCLKAGIPEGVIASSKRYGIEISKKILAYAKADGYSKISNLPRYAPVQREGYWYPTPPAYMAAVEPYFNTVRPFFLDSCSQFKPATPLPFSKEKNSGFYKMLLENYKINGDQPLEQAEIASFWDCNPFAVQENGHLLVGLKKISPGAHWLGITGIACVKSNKSFSESMLINTMVSMTLMDAFMACWDEKFRSDRIRPETAIRKYIDPSWKPLLQTPPFPEYPSGHSTISAASAGILTHYIGPDFSYTDTVEIKYGLPARNFSSFAQAAKEAAISRFYGGIHFMDAVENGEKQGKLIAAFILKKVQSVD